MVSMPNWAARWFGGSERRLRAMRRTVVAINAREAQYEKLDDAALRAMTPAFKQRLASGESVDALLPDAFAVVREAAKRVLGQRPFDVQLIGGMILHEGNIAEMKTGEGKTLAATLPCYLNALGGEPVHVVTVNDYLAKRDAAWMGQVYQFLGLSTGCILNEIADADRKAAYAADITYGTNNEFGFDYLRDNMKYSTNEMVQRGHRFAIVDEVDSILIDEARTPLIISGPAEDRTQLYTQIDGLIPQLEKEHWELDEKTRVVALTEAGNERMETLLRSAKVLRGEESLYDIAQVALVHHISNALRAHKAFLHDRDYIVKDGEVLIIDEFTGRMMSGRRYSDGLHQALEAKERVTIQAENQTLASITFQNYFRLYDKLAGMTGTAFTEQEEFRTIYDLDVVVVPTNEQVRREDQQDEIYRTAEEKATAIVEMIKECQTRGQPMLIGTVSIEKSERLAARLKQERVPHNVLNARYHEQEAQIIAQAGRAGAVTIATNMAGRGTDIQLGGNPEMLTAAGERRSEAEIAEERARVVAAGGLCVVGTERHESRRIDNQLRGRSGRQGDPGRSRFFLSLDDDLMRIFGTNRMDGVLQRLGLKDGEAIVHPWITKALERAQKKVEAHNFDMRKQVLKYDDVMNDQRNVIFAQRRELMESESVGEMVTDMRTQVVEDACAAHMPPKSYVEQWDMQGLAAQLQNLFANPFAVEAWADEDGMDDGELRERVLARAEKLYAERREHFGDEVIAQLEKTLLLQILDQHWREHLSALEHLRQIVSLRGYGQRDPLSEYKLEAFNMFGELLANVRSDVLRLLMTVELREERAPELVAPREAVGGRGTNQAQDNTAVLRGAETSAGTDAPSRDMPSRDTRAALPPEAMGKKIPRNAPCPCKSGKKYKHCHGA